MGLGMVARKWIQWNFVSSKGSSMGSKQIGRFMMMVMLGCAQGFAQSATNAVASASPDAADGEAYIPSSLETLFSKESSYQTRCIFVNGLKIGLQEYEKDALLRFLASSPEEVGLSRSHYNSVGDKVLGALERQYSIQPELVDLLVDTFNDQDCDFTWRDYCVQHLGVLYASGGAAGKRELIRSVWQEAIRPESRMAGTVVLALYR